MSSDNKDDKEKEFKYIPEFFRPDARLKEIYSIALSKQHNADKILPSIDRKYAKQELYADKELLSRAIDTELGKAKQIFDELGKSILDNTTRYTGLVLLIKGLLIMKKRGIFEPEIIGESFYNTYKQLEKETKK